MMDLHTKQTDSHLYLLKQSYHLGHHKPTILYRQFLRLCHICSREDDYQKTEDLTKYLIDQGYDRMEA